MTAKKSSGNNSSANDVAPNRPRRLTPAQQHSRGWRDAIVRAAYRRDHDGQRYLDLMAQRLVQNALAGDNVALQHIGERLDGKAQATGPDGSARISFVVHMPAPLDRDQWQQMANTIEHTPATHPAEAPQLPQERDQQYRIPSTSQPHEGAQTADMATQPPYAEPSQQDHQHDAAKEQDQGQPLERDGMGVSEGSHSQGSESAGQNERYNVTSGNAEGTSEPVAPTEGAREGRDGTPDNVVSWPGIGAVFGDKPGD